MATQQELYSRGQTVLFFGAIIAVGLFIGFALRGLYGHHMLDWIVAVTALVVAGRCLYAYLR